MLFPITLSSDNTAVEIMDFFPLSKLPSQAAISYRRNQINTTAFEMLFKNFTAKLSFKNTYRGMQLIACDGTRLNTPYNPRDLDSFSNNIEDRKGFNQYHLNTCYDILNDVFLDAVIQGFNSMDETAAFCEMLDHFPSDIKALFTADRGYDSYNVIAHAIKNNHKFVIRLKSTKALSIFTSAKEYNRNKVFDIEDDIIIGRVRTKASKTLKNYHFIRYNQRYDYIPSGSKETDSFHVRMVKFELPGGGSEYLLTNLDKADFSLEDIKEIYRLRWGIETSFKFLKYASGLQHIHSIKQSFIFQEIFAKLICYNFCSAVMKAVGKTSKKSENKYKYELEKTYVIKACIKYLKGKLSDIATLISKRKAPIRADRRFERNIRRQHADPLQCR